MDGIPVQARWDAALADGHRSGALTGYAVVHLHGGLTYADSDGWTENLTAPGPIGARHLPNDQRAAMLWYHDHVMGVTVSASTPASLACGSCATSASESSSSPRDRRTRSRSCSQDRNFDSTQTAA